MKVLLDVDGVVCDFIGGFLELVYKATGKKFHHRDLTDWSFEKCLGLTSDDMKKIEFLMGGYGFVLSLSVLPGAQEGIEMLRTAGHEVVFVTSPYPGHPTWMYERDVWLKERWPDIDVVHTEKKVHVDGHFLIDDKVSKLVAWERGRKGRKPICWTMPHNVFIGGPEHAGSWRTVLSIIHRTAQNPGFRQLVELTGAP